MSSYEFCVSNVGCDYFCPEMVICNYLFDCYCYLVTQRKIEEIERKSEVEVPADNEEAEEKPKKKKKKQRQSEQLEEPAAAVEEGTTRVTPPISRYLRNPSPLPHYLCNPSDSSPASSVTPRRYPHNPTPFSPLSPKSLPLLPPAISVTPPSPAISVTPLPPPLLSP